MKKKESEKWCKECGFRNRGNGKHESGNHHKLRGENVNKRRAARAPKK